MYAETDFVLALVKESDWLKANAEKIYEIYKKEIWSSQLTLQELMMYSYKNKIDPIAVIENVASIIDIKNVPITNEFLIAAGHVMNRYKATPFDAMHAIIARQDGTIISSDPTYDRIGIKRIRLEEGI